MRELIGIGVSLVDVLLLLDRFPREDEKRRAEARLTQGGGQCATALCCAARLGANCAYMGCVGGDEYARFMLDQFRSFGVGVEDAIEKPGCDTAVSYVLISRAGATRTCVWAEGGTPSIAPEELNESALRKCRILHLDGHHARAAARAARIAREQGALVCLDAGRMYPDLELVLPQVDLLMPGEAFARELSGEADAERAAVRLQREYGCKLVAVTQGAQGGLLYEGGRLRRYAAFPVEAVDTNGAGDVFHGAFLAALLRGFDCDESARFASAVSAIKCQALGARSCLPTWDEAARFLRERA